jgi:hypothetical protein
LRERWLGNHRHRTKAEDRHQHQRRSGAPQPARGKRQDSMSQGLPVT